MLDQTVLRSSIESASETIAGARWWKISALSSMRCDNVAEYGDVADIRLWRP